MQIRPYRKVDESAVIGLWDRCAITRPWNDPREDIARKLRVQSDWFLVGIVDDKIIATVMAGYDGHRGGINYLAVDPEHRLHGHGRAMMVEAERILRDVGCPKINVQVREDNLEAITFYRKLGFAEDAVVNLGKRLISDE